MRRAYFLLVVVFFTTEVLVAATITVTGTGDTIAIDGACTLREAITAANTNAATGDCTAGSSVSGDVIQFNIAGGGPHVIAPTSPLPNIAQQLTIDGYSQPGAVANTSASGNNAVLKIVISGAMCPLPPLQNGISALRIMNTAAGSVIAGLVINGWTGSGVVVNADNCVVRGNFIGTNAAGTSATPNCISGNGLFYTFGAVLVIPSPLGSTATANGNTIGGTVPQDRNVISSNRCPGVQITAGGFPEVGAPGNTAALDSVFGNHIGTVAIGSGTSGNNFGSLPNLGPGVLLDFTSNTTVGSGVGTTPGGACTGACNVIMGGGGVKMTGSHSGTVNIQGNFIGVDANGVNALPPEIGVAGRGVEMTGDVSSGLGATILLGGPTPETRNVISGWSLEGILTSNASTTCPPTCPAVTRPGTLTIQGNYIGTNSAGNGSLPNAQHGIRATVQTNLQIGGAVAGMGNVIASSGFNGIQMEGVFGSFVQGNYIGTAADGFTPMGSRFTGIELIRSGQAKNDGNTFGAASPNGPGANIIANNGILEIHAAGVGIMEGLRNKILGNSIYNNVSGQMDGPTSLAIDLMHDGVTNNDPCDVDVNLPNNLQNYPVLTSASSDEGSTTVSGSLNSNASSTFTLEFFASATNGRSDAQRPLGTTTVTTDANCTSGNFRITVPSHSYPGESVTATTTNTNGDTSEVSKSSVAAAVIGAPSGDYNASGTRDLLLRNSVNGEVSMWLLNGPAVVASGIVGSPGGTYKIAGVADFDGDGKSDILLRDGAGNIGMWFMNGLVITGGAAVGSPGPYTVAAVADFDGDGMADILLRDALGNIGMWLMNGAVITGGALVGSPGPYTVVGARDFNGDGKADILLRDDLGTLGMWIMNGPVIASGALVGSPIGYSVAGIGDFNGDMRADILLQDSLGNLGMWLMDGATITSGASVGSPSGYVIAAVGDYNNDGRADLILKNVATSDLGMWLMNGPTIIGGAFVGAPGVIYQIH
jgi:CSLREA domain-containing protein